jgi:chromosome segregation ATPase
MVKIEKPVFGLFVLLAACCVGCKSTAVHVDNGSLINHQREVDRLESELRSRDGTIRDAARDLESISEQIGSVAERSGRMEDEIDTVIRLFDEYQQRVERMLRDYNSVRDETEVQGQGD